MDTTEPLDLLHAKRSPTVWFEDGNTIIWADNNLFKVYAGILCRQSAFFHEVLTSPRTNDAEIFEGCHVIRLGGMSAQGMQLFLSCLHDFAEYHRAAANFEEVALLLRMSQVFKAASVKERILVHLSSMFPQTIQQFLLSKNNGWKEAASFDYTSAACNICIANVAREVGALEILPAALYRLCGRRTEHLMYASLSPENVRSVLVGRSSISACARESTYKNLLDLTSEGHGCCQETISALAAKLTAAGGWLDPLAVLDSSEGTTPLCPPCAEHVKRCYAEGRASIWSRLPEFFELGTWENMHVDEDLRVPPNSDYPPLGYCWGAVVGLVCVKSCQDMLFELCALFKLNFSDCVVISITLLIWYVAPYVRE